MPLEWVSDACSRMGSPLKTINYIFYDTLWVLVFLPPRIWLVNYNAASVAGYAADINDAIFIHFTFALYKLDDYLAVCHNAHDCIFCLVPRWLQSERV